MKKGLAAVITVLACLGALFIQGGLAVPEIENLSGAVCTGNGGMVYVAGYGQTSEGIYGIDGSGSIQEYTADGEPEWGETRQVIRLYDDGNVLYRILEKRNAANRNLQGYCILGTEQGTGETVIRADVGPEVFSKVTDLSVADGKPVISGISNDGRHLAGYAVDRTAGGSVNSAGSGTKGGTANGAGSGAKGGSANGAGSGAKGGSANSAGSGAKGGSADSAKGVLEKGELTLLYLQPVPAGETAADSVYFGKTVFIRTERGRIGKYTDYGYVDIRQEERPSDENFFIRGEQGVWSYEKELGRVLPVSRGALGGFGIPDNVKAEAGYMDDDGRFLFLGKRSDGAGLLCCQMSDYCLQYEALTPSLRIRFRFAMPYVPRTICGTVVVWLVLLGVWWIYGKSGKISLKLSFTCFAAAFFLMLWWLWLLKTGGHSGAQLRLLFTTGGITCGLLAALLFVWVEYITMPLRHLKRYMDRITAGNYQILKKIRSNDEVSEVWFSVTRMCQSLEEQRYRGRQLIKSYYRFVPREIHRVFGKDSIVDLAEGEVRKIDGMVGLVSVLNREEIRENMRDEEYMEMIKTLFLLLTETVELHDGILASGELDLSGIKVLFLKAADGAMAFGLNLLALCRERRGSGRDGPELFILIHRTGYLYGLAGNGEQSLPFFVSGEMEYLSEKIRQFHGTGTGMVMTGMALAASDQKPENRYIGYFMQPDNKTKCELYEVLGACPEAVRVVKRQCGDKFQEGLELYYKNDFYLARNLFLSVLKECPQDGIARWYLFACEYYFNSGVENGTDHSLFGTAAETGGGYEFPV